MIFSFKAIILAITQIFILGSLGFFLVKRKVLSSEGLDNLTKLLVEWILPSFIFVQLIKNFDFSLYKNWWLLPILSILINATGFIIAWGFLKITKLRCERGEFLSLVTFQNSGYLPLVLVAGILPSKLADSMFIYIFLFLIGFNILIWSFGVSLLKDKKIENRKLSGIFNPPFLALSLAFLIIGLGFKRFIPQFIINPIEMFGRCTFPLALIVIGASLADVHIGRLVNKRQLFDVILLKQVFLPTIALIVLSRFNLGFLLGLLIILETAMPSATSLSIISRHYRDKETLISQGIFFGHIASIFTIPIFLYLFTLLF